jgi:23S rRNA (guanosine2251-2'-O)-methyltransferase
LDKIIKGLHGIEEALRSGACSGTLYICRKAPRIKAVQAIADRTGVKVVSIPPAEMDKRFGADNRGAALLLRAGSGVPLKEKAGKGPAGRSFENAVDAITGGNALVILLDGLTDPHNYGAVLRSADQFGIDLVVTRARRSVSESDTVARTSAGAVSYVNTIVVKNLSRAIDYLKKSGFWVYSSEMNGSPVDTLNLKGRTAIVMGSEGKGVSRLLAEKCDSCISIPVSGNIDSLNVSVAAGIIMYEVRRQQRSS